MHSGQLAEYSGFSDDPLEILALADPELARKINAGLRQKQKPVSPDEIALLVEEILHSVATDISLGYLTAEGYGLLAGTAEPARLRAYGNNIRSAAETGLNFGRLMAAHLPPVLCYGTDTFVAQFSAAVELMRQRGEYTLNSPLEAVSLLLNTGAHEDAAEFVALLIDLFSHKISYKTALYLSKSLSMAVTGFSPEKRRWQTTCLRRIAQANVEILQGFTEAMSGGLNQLSETALNRFISDGLEKLRHNSRLGRKFLCLESRMGKEACSSLRVAASFSQVRHGLNRYVQARTGLDLPVRPLSALKEIAGIPAVNRENPSVCSNGKFIYLPDEISVSGQYTENADLYKTLVRLESAVYEFGTFDFDADWSADHAADEIVQISDLEHFLENFERPVPANDLFSILALGRLRFLLARVYPGIAKKAFAVLETAFDADGHPMAGLYRRTVLHHPLTDGTSFEETAAIRLETALKQDCHIRTCARILSSVYAEAVQFLPDAEYIAFSFPLGWKIRPALFFNTFRIIDQQAGKIRSKLAVQGFRVSRTGVRKRLSENRGQLSAGNLQELILSAEPEESDSGGGVSAGNSFLPDLSKLNFQGIATTGAADISKAGHPEGAVFRYPEWDEDAGDYLPDHVQVHEVPVPAGDSEFYAKTLLEYGGLLRRMRRAFEMLRPEGLTVLRKWVEGDEFDYRALLDFALDRKAGIMPSDRLYIKRLKQERDVAVLLLVDLSRSTANTVPGTERSVLDVEKTAVVLFCEALSVVGDAFAVAVFSGNSRAGVEYCRIKDFDESLTAAVRERISAMSPRRNTRTGAAVRHAVQRLSEAPARVRVLMILGDGFPNDLDYKQAYAVADTRKAVSEARSRNIHARAITVNVTSGDGLDAVYGPLHHNVISDVRELPDRLLRIYSALTR